MSQSAFSNSFSALVLLAADAAAGYGARYYHSELSARDAVIGANRATGQALERSARQIESLIKTANTRAAIDARIVKSLPVIASLADCAVPVEFSELLADQDRAARDAIKAASDETNAPSK